MRSSRVVERDLGVTESYHQETMALRGVVHGLDHCGPSGCVVVPDDDAARRHHLESVLGVGRHTICLMAAVDDDHVHVLVVRTEVECPAVTVELGDPLGHRGVPEPRTGSVDPCERDVVRSVDVVRREIERVDPCLGNHSAQQHGRGALVGADLEDALRLAKAREHGEAVLLERIHVPKPVAHVSHRDHLTPRPAVAFNEIHRECPGLLVSPETGVEKLLEEGLVPCVAGERSDRPAPVVRVHQLIVRPTHRPPTSDDGTRRRRMCQTSDTRTCRGDVDRFSGVNRRPIRRINEAMSDHGNRDAGVGCRPCAHCVKEGPVCLDVGPHRQSDLAVGQGSARRPTAGAGRAGPPYPHSSARGVDQ